MSYFKDYFGKEREDLQYSDIESFFLEPQDESNKIEFKSYVDRESYDSQLDNIIKNVCAFLNSEGGIIIWGAPVGTRKQDDPKQKIFVGALTPLNKNVEQDSFIRKITDSITPSPRAILFKQLEKSENNREFIYVVEVEKSIYSPHQFKDLYYMRIDGQTKKAPHHYIEALFRKISFPKLEGYLVIDNTRVDVINVEEGRIRLVVQYSFFVFNHSKLQNEYDISLRVITDVGIFSNSLSVHIKNYSFPNQNELEYFKAKDILFYGSPFVHKEIMEFKIENLLQPLNQRVYFFFGGKSSPFLISEYLIEYKFNELLNIYEGSFVLKNENQYVHEKTELVGLSNKEFVSQLIGRAT